MDLDRLLERCRRDQWSLKELDWSRPPRAMGAGEEMSIVQYFTDMGGIERLAGALFAEEGKKSKDERLRAIFKSFLKDEIRHARVAERLARHFDVHHYKRYQPNPHFERFYPAFLRAVRHLSPEVANVYITTGELILDVALLRSLQGYVNDPLCDQAMLLINRDESRHIAADFHMVEYYASAAYQADRAAEPARPIGEALSGWLALVEMMYWARPFLKAVFFEPMAMVDPSGRRLLEAMKRIQIIANRPDVRERPFVKMMLTFQDLFRNPLIGFLFGRVLLRLIGTDPEFVDKLYSEDELRRAEAMSFDELADEALALKYAN